MLSDLTNDQKKLADAMSDLSEKCYSAGWESNLEYVLWHAVTTGERKYGQGIITQQDIDDLIKLSEACVCWIYFSDTTEETAIKLIQWKQKFQDAILKDPSIID